jgi:ferredoxin-like protein FixX
MTLTQQQRESLAKLIEYNYDSEVTHFEEEYDVDTTEMSQQDIIDLCEAEGYTDHILYDILILGGGK